MNRPDLHVLSARGVHAALDLDLGQIAAFKVSREGRDAAPFHRVPWAETAMPEVDMPPHLRRMSVDFFCAPFAACDAEEAPFHGWPANSSWRLVQETRLPDGMEARFQLDRKVMGATVTKTLIVRDDHPFLYQAHRFENGAGRLPVAHHAMVHFPADGLLSFSEKLRAETDTPLESDPARGRSILHYPASAPLDAFPQADGGTVDLHGYPLAERHEDLVLLVERPDNPLGWAAAVRPEQKDMALVLKSPATLPVTVLWFSNGGRFYPPWSGRHNGVLGIEEACSNFTRGHRESVAPNRLSDSGLPTSVSLDGGVEIRAVIGALPFSSKPSRVRSVEIGEGTLLISTGEWTTRVPYDPTFLGASASPVVPG